MYAAILSSTFGPMLAFKLVAKAGKGDMKAMNAVLDRAEGKVRQNVKLSDAKDDALTQGASSPCLASRGNKSTRGER
jgi:hypothetical protein